MSSGMRVEGHQAESQMPVLSLPPRLAPHRSLALFSSASTLLPGRPWWTQAREGLAPRMEGGKHRTPKLILRPSLTER